MFTSPGDIAFIICIPIYYYGITMAIALLSGVLTTGMITRRLYPEIKSDVIYDIAPHIIIFGILGARLYYCLLSLPYYSKHFFEIFMIWHGGLSIHGAILGGLLGGVLYAKRHHLPTLKLCDLFAYGLAIGQSVGRWGNFFNSEAFGAPTNNFLKLYIPIYKRPLEYMQYDYFHPTFLYESIADFCIFLILFNIVRRLSKGKDGIVFFMYLILYSIVRILIEQIRIDSVLNVFGIPVAQIISALIIIISVKAIFVIKSKNESS